MATHSNQSADFLIWNWFHATPRVLCPEILLKYSDPICWLIGLRHFGGDKLYFSASVQFLGCMFIMKIE